MDIGAKRILEWINEVDDGSSDFVKHYLPEPSYLISLSEEGRVLIYEAPEKVKIQTQEIRPASLIELDLFRDFLENKIIKSDSQLHLNEDDNRYEIRLEGNQINENSIKNTVRGIIEASSAIPEVIKKYYEMVDTSGHVS